MINLKVRIKNPLFLAQLVLAVGAPVLAYGGLTAADLTTWGTVGKLVLDALSNPYVLALVAVSVFNALNDPTVAGLADSKQARRYEYPKDPKGGF